MTYGITRQVYYYTDENPCFVEIVKGGVDFSGADMLAPRYPGEGYDYDDPLEALRTANMIACQWRAEEPGEVINVTFVATGGMGFEGEPMTPTELVERIMRDWFAMPVCTCCGKRQEELNWCSIYWPMEKCCSQYCAEQVESMLFNAEDEEIEEMMVL